MRSGSREFARGQYLGAGVCAAAILAAVSNSLLGGVWQVSVSLVSVPVLGVASALINARRMRGVAKQTTPR